MSLSVITCQPKMTSSTVSGWPSLHLILGRNFQVTIIVPSALSTQSPSLIDGIFSTSHGCTLRSASRYVKYALSDCSTSIAAIWAIVTPKPFGSWDMAIVRVLPPTAGAAGAAAAAVVGAATATGALVAVGAAAAGPAA